MDFLNRILAFDLQVLPYIIITLIIAFTLHEFSHAYVAYKFGDDTAARQGRLTLNPVVHLDPIGTILLLIAGFGWARPVPVNRFNFKNPRLAGLLVTIAGPLSNLLLAIVGAFLRYLLYSNGIAFLDEFFFYFIYLNVLLFVFNLLPLPPLDGYRVIQDLVPPGVRAKMTQYEVYGMIFFLIILVVPGVSQWTIGPFLRGGIAFFFGGIDGFMANLFF